MLNPPKPSGRTKSLSPHPSASTQDTAVNQLERLLSVQATQVYVLRLYVSGASPRSLQAIRNITSVCDEHLADRYALEVVDVYQQPDRAREDHVVALPVLVKKQPLPLRRLVGSLSNRRQVLRTLGLQRKAVAPSVNRHS